MKNHPESALKIILLRYLKVIFYLLIAIGGLLFIVFSIYETYNFIRNTSISLIIMVFGYLFNEIINNKINEYFSIYNNLKTKKVTNKSVIIEFNKIA